MTKKIAVITPTLNQARFLNECIESVRNSITLGKFELEHIVIDDGSSDQSRQIIEKINSPHLKKIYLKKNVGQAAAANTGIAASNADYIFPLDGDDLVLQNALRYLFETSEQLEGNFWVYGDAITTDEKLSYLKGKDYYGWQFASPAEFVVSVFTKKHTCLQTALYKRSVFNKAGGYNENLHFSLTTDLFIRFIQQKYYPHFAPVTTILRRVHDSNISLEHILNPDKRFDDLKNTFERYRAGLVQILSRVQIEEIESFFRNHSRHE